MRKLITFLCLLLCISGCSNIPTAQREHFAMDTLVTFKVSGPNAEAAIDAAIAEIDRLDALFSVGNPNSALSLLNAGADCTISDDTAALIDAAMDLCVATNRAFDCQLQPLIEAWGWYGDSPAIPTEEAIRDALQRKGYDMGGIAKGYAAGRVAALLQLRGIDSALVDLGGNIRALGCKPDGSDWVIGIDDPMGKSAYLGTVAVRDCAVVTSGINQRFFEQDGQRWHHILDPKTGWPAKNGLVQVSIVCADDTLADGLSTALFVMGAEEAISFWRSGVYDFAFILVTDEGSILVSEGLNFACNLPYEVIPQ